MSEAKQYHIGEGVNLSGSEENLNQYTFSGNLGDFFDREDGYRLKLRYLRQLPEYRINRDMIEKIEFNTVEEKVKKCYELLGSEIKEKVEKHFEGPIQYIQDLTANAFEEGRISKEENQCLLKIKDGKAILDGEYLLHNMSIVENMEEYESRKDLGILASEWFGRSEKMGEAYFCSFFSKMENINPTHVEGKMLTLIVDANNPTIKNLKQNDYFNYVKNRENQEYMSSLSEEQIQTFEFIYSYCGGPVGPSDVAFDNPDWVAIPGGVPPQFIVGIMIPDNIPMPKEIKPDPFNPNPPIDKITPEKAHEIAKSAADIFGVPLIDSQLNVLYNPNEKSKNDSRENTTKTASQDELRK